MKRWHLIYKNCVRAAIFNQQALYRQLGMRNRILTFAFNACSSVNSFMAQCSGYPRINSSLEDARLLAPRVSALLRAVGIAPRMHKEGASFQVKEVFSNSYALRDRLIILGCGKNDTPILTETFSRNSFKKIPSGCWPIIYRLHPSRKNLLSLLEKVRNNLWLRHLQTQLLLLVQELQV